MRSLIHSLGFAVALIVLTTRCGGKFEPDPIDPRLPRYSEEGLKAAGAFVNGVRWRAVQGVSFLGGTSQNMNVYRDSSQIRLTIDGRMSGSPFLGIEFYLDNTDGDLDRTDALGGRTFSLDGPHYATVRDQEYRVDDSSRCPSRAGQLYVKHLERVVGESSVDYILSGTFSFVVDADSCTQYEVTFGRFDYRVDGY